MSTFNKDLEDRPVTKLPVAVPELRRLRYLVERASRNVHSNARMLRDEKLAVLSPLADVKKSLDQLLQLSLFSLDQLER